jgi:hypothetical protein
MRSDKNNKTIRGNVDCVVTEQWAGRPRIRGSIPGRGKTSVPVPNRPDRLGGHTHSPVQWVLGAFSPVTDQSESEADH